MLCSRGMHSKIPKENFQLRTLSKVANQSPAHLLQMLPISVLDLAYMRLQYLPFNADEYVALLALSCMLFFVYSPWVMIYFKELQTILDSLYLV